MVGKSYQQNNGKAITLGQLSLSKANLEVGYFQKQVCMEQRGHGSHFEGKVSLQY